MDKRYKWVKEEWVIGRKLSFKQEALLCLLMKSLGMQFREEYFSDKSIVVAYPYISRQRYIYSTGDGFGINRYTELTHAVERAKMRKVSYAKVKEALIKLIKEEAVVLMNNHSQD